jgi:hypothetical protein
MAEPMTVEEAIELIFTRLCDAYTRNRDGPRSPRRSRRRRPESCGKEKWRILPVGEVHDQPAALAGGHRRNAPWAKVSASRSQGMSLSRSR